MQSFSVIPDPNSPNVVLVFSVRSTTPGKFTYWKTVQGLPATKVFVNDFSSRWYIDGTPDFGSHEEFLSALKETVGKYLRDDGELWTVGSSMGGYAALKYGSLLGAKKILSFGAESELCIPLGKSVTSVKDRREGDEPIYSLPQRDDAAISVVFGNNDIVDLYSATKFKHYNPAIHLISLNNHVHAVAGKLAETTDMAALFKNFFRTGKVEELQSSPIATFEDASAIKKLNEDFHVRKKIDLSSLSAVENSLKDNPDWSMGNYLYGILLQHSGFVSAALNHFRVAYTLNPELGRARLRSAEILFERARYNDVVTELDCLMGKKFNFDCASLTSRSQFALGNKLGAISAWDRFLKHGTNSKQVAEAKDKASKLLGAYASTLGLRVGVPL